MTFEHNPDLNPAWRPKVAFRIYACEGCGHLSTHQTNHTGGIYNTRCEGKCRTISNAHTARERVGPAYTCHRYVEDLHE